MGDWEGWIKNEDFLEDVAWSRGLECAHEVFKL